MIRIPRNDGILKKVAEMLLNKILSLSEGEEESQIRCYTDVLIILSNADMTLQNLITQKVITNTERPINSFLVKILLRRNLMNLKEFDTLAS